MKLHYGRVFQDRLDTVHGLPRARLAELERRFGDIHAEVRRRREGGEYGFYQLGEQPVAVQQIRRFAEGVGQAFDHVLVLGIGGSALGMKALLNALKRPGWNELDDEGREFFPKLTVLDNVDPTSVAEVLRRMDPRRALVNVVRNAAQAGGRTVTATASLVRWRNREAVRLDVADTGPGIDAETAKRVFEPFFTTKATGTGLGLAIVRSIVEGHGGEVTLASSSDGTTVTIHLPLGRSDTP